MLRISVTRVSTQGKLTVRVDVVLKDMNKFGFQTVSRRGLPSHDPPTADLSKLVLGRPKVCHCAMVANGFSLSFNSSLLFQNLVEEAETSTPIQSDEKAIEDTSPAPPSDNVPRPLPNLED